MKFNFKMKRESAKKLLMIIITALIVLVVVTGASAFLYQYYGSSLGSGTFNNTLYNSTGAYVYLNYTDATNTSYVKQGNYTSTIMDFGSASTGYSQISWKGSGTCPYQNMSYIDKLGGYCIDQYEAYQINSTAAGSATGKTPWVSVTQTSARTACANVGKHLCSSAEWLGAANIKGKVYYLPADLSASPYLCNTNSKCEGAACATGNSTNCVSAEGVYDMIGNVWEWTNEVVTTIAPAGCTTCYPNSTGKFSSSTGIATAKYGNDYVYFSPGTNVGKAVYRGGGWDDGADAGPFAAALDIGPASAGTGIGFRCCSVASG